MNSEFSFQDSYLVPLPEPVCAVEPKINQSFESAQFRFSLSSPLTNEKTFDFLVPSRKLVPLRTKAIGGIPKFSPSDYVATRSFVRAQDGKEVPLTLIHQKNLNLNGRSPLLITVYGAYGQSLYPRYRPEHIPLLQRGWIIAIAHVRGGSELGSEWYHQGKREHKMNSITDFICCCEYLVARGYTNPRALFAYGSSAGGIVLGAAANMKPDLFRAMIFKVPFLDVVTSMLDSSLPLTIHEYDEWGNPSISQSALQHMLNYDPYMNVQLKPYPAIYVTSSTLDTRVPYWHQFKWVGKLRACSTSALPIILHVDEDTGHFGDTGRFNSLLQSATEYSFLFKYLS
eukprot:TRINITY_DN8593_c0_g1_i1.p1 TRINITY_DN8593_c0_g1~~TRINITY_DN8593_c0_g1_i1.p1  ORF type:complete len:342 (+),score=25.05 TRINITY_DN8593_c0_g1_i1:129-1154(+)